MMCKPWRLSWNIDTLNIYLGIILGLLLWKLKIIYIFLWLLSQSHSICGSRKRRRDLVHTKVIHTHTHTPFLSCPVVDYPYVLYLPPLESKSFEVTSGVLLSVVHGLLPIEFWAVHISLHQTETNCICDASNNSTYWQLQIDWWCVCCWLILPMPSSKEPSSKLTETALLRLPSEILKKTIKALSDTDVKWLGHEGGNAAMLVMVWSTTSGGGWVLLLQWFVSYLWCVITATCKKYVETQFRGQHICKIKPA